MYLKMQIICAVMLSSSAAPFGPVYPITASWFRDRYSAKEWNATLNQFKVIGGDTVWQRAPPVVRRSRDDLVRDMNFAWCGSSNSSTGATGIKCFDEALKELSALGLKVLAFVTYQYEEGFSDDIMLCQNFDRKISSSRIYYRLVLPTSSQSDPCHFPTGSSVVVLFTSFAGTDPHELLVRTAAANNMSVYLSLPSAPKYYVHQGFDQVLMPAYYAFVSRVLHEHKVRYSKVMLPDSLQFGTDSSASTLYDVIRGYYSTDETCLAQVDAEYIQLYRNLGKMVHAVNKCLATSSHVDLNRSHLNATIAQHVSGFVKIVRTSAVDVVAVHEGRGEGQGCYYWPGQEDTPVVTSDPTLDDIIRYLNPSIRANITYREAFTASNQELFKTLGEVKDRAFKEGINFEYWLSIEAFEYLRGDPCLPVDPAASGMAELLDRTSKSRIDRALTAAGATSQKIISFAWDSDFLCTTNQYKTSLESDIRYDISRPIIANCSFHSSDNISVVVIGYNLDGETQAFYVDWPGKDGKRHHDTVYGYYYEEDWGQKHEKVPSLVYIMLWDIPDMNLDLKGLVTVQAQGSYHNCEFEYNYSQF